MRKLSLVILLFLLAANSWAHQPRFVMDTPTGPNNPILIPDPEVSKAYYGELTGSADYYKISSGTTFAFYVNVLSPDVPDYNRTDLSVEVLGWDGKKILALNGRNQTWERFYEEFGGDYYLKGPEARMNLSGGEYTIIVSSPDNRGRYSLAVGETESFPPGEIANAYLLSPTLKSRFFNKPFYEGFFTKFNLYATITILILVAVIVYFLAKKLHHAKK